MKHTTLGGSCRSGYFWKFLNMLVLRLKEFSIARDICLQDGVSSYDYGYCGNDFCFDRVHSN